VTTTAAETGPVSRSLLDEEAGDDQTAWYLYGITGARPPLTALADADGGESSEGPAADDAAPLQLLEDSGLVAVVRTVDRAEFSLPVLQDRLADAASLETLVRRHNRVIEAIHREQAILPAKFGGVYRRAGDIIAALRSHREALLRQLTELEGCDEWGVHLFANPAAVRERVAAEDPRVRRLREERDAARPGRAYFLERQLRDELEAATRQALVTLAQAAFDRLAACAVGGELSAAAATADAEEVEILRAAFLVRREEAGRFDEEMHSLASSGAGMRWECSGPWPPYSFAAGIEERAE
jgi:hypothetical protein